MTQKEIQDRFIKEMPAPYGQQAADNTITDNAAGWDDVMPRRGSGKFP